MMFQCATCSSVTVWTRVCMAPMTQFPHLAAKLADQGAQSQGTTSHSSAAATARNSIDQYVTDIHSQVQGEGQVLLPSSGSRILPPILPPSYPTSTGYIRCSVTSFCRTPVFSLWFADCRQMLQDGQITEHVSYWLKVNYDELRDLL